MKVSIITVTLDCAGTVEDCLRSVEAQTHPDVEHVIVDGGSTDGTVEVIRLHEGSIAHWISEPDGGIYDALNKGIRIATGDSIGILHADDFYADERVIVDVVKGFEETGADVCYGNLDYVDSRDPDRVVRHWVSGACRPGSFRSRGWMPPHPTLFVRRRVYETAGLFDTSFRIAADYEFMLRVFENRRASACHVPRVLVKMRTGGVSNRSLRHVLRKSWEDYRAWRTNRLRPSLFTIAMKNLRKISQFWQRPKDDVARCRGRQEGGK